MPSHLPENFDAPALEKQSDLEWMSDIFEEGNERRIWRLDPIDNDALMAVIVGSGSCTLSSHGRNTD